MSAKTALCLASVTVPHTTAAGSRPVCLINMVGVLIQANSDTLHQSTLQSRHAVIVRQAASLGSMNLTRGAMIGATISRPCHSEQ